MNEIHTWSIDQIAENLHRRSVSVAEVTEAHIARMEAVNPGINAITTPVHEALDVAKALDAAGRPDDAHPMWGVPVTTKTNVDQKGYPNSNGVAAYARAIASDDSPIVANLKAAGAVIIGRTNTPEYSMRWFTSNPLHGESLNPWNPEITPGGSSGAAAAAVACGIGAVGHGNDLGGSLRYPAYCCGVATIRPSLGRVPAGNPTQSAAGIERPPMTQMMSVQGPIARCVADVQTAFDVMARRDIRDALWVSVAEDDPSETGAMTVGYAVNPFGGPLDPAVETAVLTAKAALEDAGIVVKEIVPPFATELPDLWGTLLFTETEALLREAIETNGSPEMRRYYDAFAGCFEKADVAGLLKALQRRLVYQRAWARMFEDVDALLLPTSLQRPFRADQDFREPETLPDILKAQAPLVAVNLLGLPSVALPTHLDGNTPLGVQLVGPMHRDRHVLALAERMEAVMGPLWPDLPI